ncbi:MAG TPA: TonB-dependent receptor [Micropepsaceae bacterium]|nr:TonB-dependent receptor [Micropepsaceae bacterium]
MASGSAVQAQTVDYGSLETLFGQAVTTSATGSPQRATDVPVNMEIVTADEIRRSGARDIPGVLAHVLGVDVMRWNSDNADVGIRGYDQAFSPRVLVLIDGRQVYADHYGYTPWAALPVELGAIRQIEVVKGSNAALFGFNAVDGVINIITYNPLYDDVNTASVRGGTQGLGEASAVKTFKFDGGGVRLSASGSRNDDFSTPIPASAGTSPRGRNDRFAADIDGIVRLGPNVQLGIEGSHSTANTNTINPVYSLSRDQNDLSSLKGQLTADTGLGLFQAMVYNNWIRQYSVSDLGTPIDFSGQETVAQIQDLFRLGTDHSFRAAVEYRHNSVGTTPFAGASVYYDDYAASGMWAWTITPSVSLTNAVRWENVRLGRSGPVPAGYPFSNEDWQHTITEFHYSSGLVWKATDEDTFRLSFSRGIELPSLANFGAFLLHNPFSNLTGDPDVEGTDVNAYEIGWDRTLPAIDGQLRVAGFSQTGVDFVSLNGEIIPGSGPPPYVAQANIGSSTGRGAEISLTGIFHTDWRWGLNYRFESIADHFIPFAQGGTRYVDFEHVTPKHVAKANLGWASGPWEIDGYLYYQSPTKGLASLPFNSGSFLTPVPDYLSFDARVGYRLTDWAILAISGQNLLESPQQQTSGPKVERSVFATLTVNY